MKRWNELAPPRGVEEIIGDTAKTIAGITAHSGEVEKDYLFVARRGTHTDGHQFIGEALRRGAGTIV